MSRDRSQAHAEHAAEPKVATVELFFDLVLVFAITQVTGLLAPNPTWGGLARRVVALAAIVVAGLLVCSPG